MQELESVGKLLGEIVLPQCVEIFLINREDNAWLLDSEGIFLRAEVFLRELAVLVIHFEGGCLTEDSAIVNTFKHGRHISAPVVPRGSNLHNTPDHHENGLVYTSLL